VARNDPTDTGGLFIGRRPGTGPLRYRTAPEPGGVRRRRADAVLAASVLVLETLLWPDEVREPAFAFLDQDVDVRPQELQMAEQLVANLAEPFEPAKYTDDYRANLMRIIKAKLKGKKAVLEEPEAPTEDARVIDLMERLQASLQRGTRDEGRGTRKRRLPTRARKARARESA
jgi:DNA end-binding protein Ku